MLFGFKDVELDIPSHVGVRSMEVKGAHSSTHVGTKHHPFLYFLYLACADDAFQFCFVVVDSLC